MEFDFPYPLECSDRGHGNLSMLGLWNSRFLYRGTRMASMGDAISHGILPGLALSFIFGILGVWEVCFSVSFLLGLPVIFASSCFIPVDSNQRRAPWVWCVHFLFCYWSYANQPPRRSSFGPRMYLVWGDW